MIHKNKTENNLAENATKALETQKKALGKVVFSEDFCIALDGTTQPIYIIDPESFEMLYCNQSFRQYLGWNPEGLPCHKAIRGLDEPCPNCVALKLYKEGINETTEYHTPQGAWMLVRASVLNWRGREVYKLSCFDITDRKQLEDELHFRGEEYKAIVQQSMTGILRYIIASDTATVNVDRNLDRVEEYTIPNFLDVVCSSKLIAPKSVKTAKTILADIQRGVSGSGYDVQLSLERDGLRWFHVDYVLIKDGQGNPYRAVFSFYDNTMRYEQELAYEQWNHRLNVLMDEDTVYMGVNLSQDVIEVEKRINSQIRYVGGRRFSETVDKVEEEMIYQPDRLKFRAFFNRERLIGQFFDGSEERILEYRAMEKKEARWFRAEVQLIREPSSGHVKASIVIRNVDGELRERERLKNEAQQDAMTEIYNHATAERLIKEVLEKNTGERCCFLVIDLDDLREINSQLGHPEGDRALKAIAACMKARFRKSDIIGRFGGDEFVVLLRNVPETEQLQVAISSFMYRLGQVKIGPQRDRLVRVSVGGAVGRAGRDDLKTLYHQADLALYYVKAMGKNGFKLYEPELEKRKFCYHPRSTAALAEMDWTNSEEFRRLLHAVTAYYPLVISANLTKNTYYMMEYKEFETQKARDEGCYDRLIEDGASTFHSEDRESFLECFLRERLLESYSKGICVVEHTGRQLGDDGIYRMARTVAVLSQEEHTGNICEISFTHVTPSDVEKEEAFLEIED